MIQNAEQQPSGVDVLLKRPLIEIRRGISLGYDAPKEESDVLALTAPSGRFVDIRWLLDPNAPSNFDDPHKIGGWATAGVAIPSVPVGTQSCVPYECTIHVEWEHPIDSSRSFTTDGADMYLLGNNDVMEIGTFEMNGKLQMFKEYWVGPKEDADLVPCVVVETTGRSPDSGKGMAIRIGNFCQGIWQDEENFWLERWDCHENAWTKHQSSNTKDADEVVPCKWLNDATRKLGDQVALHDRVWTVTEAFV